MRRKVGTKGHPGQSLPPQVWALQLNSKWLQYATTKGPRETEGAIHYGHNRDEDCSASARQLMEMRRRLAAFIGERNSLGGHERMLNVEGRLKADYHASNPKPLKGTIRRRG
jgi:hypothetical protein